MSDNKNGQRELPILGYRKKTAEEIAHSKNKNDLLTPVDPKAQESFEKRIFELFERKRREEKEERGSLVHY